MMGTTPPGRILGIWVVGGPGAATAAIPVGQTGVVDDDCVGLTPKRAVAQNADRSHRSVQRLTQSSRRLDKITRRQRGRHPWEVATAPWPSVGLHDVPLLGEDRPVAGPLAPSRHASIVHEMSAGGAWGSQFLARPLGRPRSHSGWSTRTQGPTVVIA